jgi:hypothetical protein
MDILTHALEKFMWGFGEMGKRILGEYLAVPLIILLRGSVRRACEIYGEV